MRTRTAKWYETTVRYERSKGDENNIATEAYAVDALSFAEAEQRITEEMEPYCSGEFDHQFKPNEGIRYPKSVLDFTQNWQRQQALHPTQKPVDLLRYLVRTYSNEGDTILDNCMGSGTTAVACIKEKRHFIGFELNKDYYDKACQRIDAEQRQLTLF